MRRLALGARPAKGKIGVKVISHFGDGVQKVFRV